MSVTYKCDNCGQVAMSLSGWFLISVSYLHEVAGAPTPPGGRTLDSTAPDLQFDKSQCRDAWCDKAGMPKP